MLDDGKWRHPPAEWTRAQRNHAGRLIDWRWREENVAVADGALILTNTREVPSPRGGDAEVYAAAVWTEGRHTWTYGYFEARIKVAPTEDGIHTAFWMNRYGSDELLGASDGAEIDIMESAFTTGRYFIAVHYDQRHRAGKRAVAQRVSMPDIHDGQFHVFAVHWHETGYDFYADGVLVWRYSDFGLAPEDSAVSHVPEFIFLSTGASWEDGNAFSGTFPNQARVDWVRVWKAR